MCRSLKFFVEKMVKAGHLMRYIKEADDREESGLAIDRIVAGATTPLESRPVINYILGGLFDDRYKLKRQQKKILRAAIVKARVKAIHKEGSCEETRPIDSPISFPPINPNKIIVPHYDALVLTLCISGFDVHRELVDPGNAAVLLQIPVFNHMRP